ncbi:MAG: TIGR00303 family protein [Methanomicrobiales archaeon]|nr:TIGR00303 family protein [Methanomicrobiales archaeon]
MPFRYDAPDIRPSKPLFSIVLANTLLSTVPGISGAGPSPEKTLDTPILDSELVFTGEIRSSTARPNTPTGCPTPATITRAMMELTSLDPLFINAGMVHAPVVPCLDMYGEAGRDPRDGDAVPRAEELFEKGRNVGRLLSRYCDLLMLGECVPGGTTTALCVLRGLGYHANVSSSFVKNPVERKEEIWNAVRKRIADRGTLEPLDVVRIAGDPMIPVAAGIALSCTSDLLLAGGTQMLAVSAVAAAMGCEPPSIATTAYVRDDPTASFERTAREVGARVYYVDPDFGEYAHSGLARYCIGEVKEGMGAGGAMILACMLGFTTGEIKERIVKVVDGFH